VSLALTKGRDLEIGREIASGATSTVFEATLRPPAPAGGGAPAPPAPERVAVKRVRIGTDADLERFRREVAVLGLLGAGDGHPGVVRLRGARALPPEYLLALEWHAGTLGDALHRRGWRPGPAEVVRVARQLADALAHCHAHGVVHRDLKPDNVLCSGTQVGAPPPPPPRPPPAPPAPPDDSPPPRTHRRRCA